ncbi:hypothetical protein ABH940_006719 [Streptacidiphilus sp. BW17]|uniref:mannosyltransferase family protein n=1 Tax=Streptacidiphilus sp. BW17 TaxID=3156274 RepID=UPI003516322D
MSVPTSAPEQPEQKAGQAHAPTSGLAIRLPVRTPRGWRTGLALALRAAEPALLLFMVVRAVGMSLIIFLSPGSVSYALRRLALHWDASWYLDIAQHGYDHAIRPMLPGATIQTTNLAFFPVYPAMIKVTHTVLPFLSWGTVGVLTASACAVGAAWGIFAATSFRYGDKIGTIAALLWGVAPVAAVETAGYSESAFTMFSAWALYCVVSRRWIAAGVLSVLAGLTRPTGVAVAAAVMCAAAMEIWLRYQERRSEQGRTRLLPWLDRLPWFDGTDLAAAPVADEPPLWKPLAAILMAPVGWVGFVAWTALRLHSWNAYFQIQAGWHSKFNFGASTAHDMRLLFTSANPVGLYYPVVAGVLIAAAVVFVTSLAQRQPLAFVMFSFVIMVISYGDTAFFSSRARFLLPAFPLLIPLAAGLARVRTKATLYAVLAACAISSGLYGAYILLYSPSAP